MFYDALILKKPLVIIENLILNVFLLQRSLVIKNSANEA